MQVHFPEFNIESDLVTYQAEEFDEPYEEIGEIKRTSAAPDEDSSTLSVLQPITDQHHQLDDTQNRL